MDKERIKQLVSLIKHYQTSYYNGEAEVEDSEFDALWDELKTLDPTNPILNKIGEDSGSFTKARHIMNMGSQEKVSTKEEFLSWCQKHKYNEYLVEYKLDGASLELQYSHGLLVRAVTRGNGTIGDDITANAVKMQGVIKKLEDKNGKVNFTGAIRGEVIMTHSVHALKFSDKANCRNAANGLMKKKDGEGVENLTLITYDVFTTNSNDSDSNDSNDKVKEFYTNEKEKILFLSNLGFCVTPLKVCKSSEEVLEYRKEVEEARDKLDYDIDGLVIKENIINYEDSLRARPERQVAFKFNLEKAFTTLLSVEWSINGATYTPVAIFSPVSLNGTTVTRASLVNPATIESLGVKIGSTIAVVKRGEIIPKIEEVLESKEGSTSINTQEAGKLTAITYPSTCEVCGKKLQNDGTRLYCPNKNCSKRVLHQLLKWIKVLDIIDLGITLITNLFNKGVVKSITDIYKLTTEDLTPFFLTTDSISKDKESLGAIKVIKSIKETSTVSLATFIAGFDIEGVGVTVAQKLVDTGYNSLEKVLSLSVEEVSNIYGFAKIMAKTLIEGLKENKEEMQALSTSYVHISENSGSLIGLSFCFTGELTTMKRAEAQEVVKKLGGVCKSSVTKDLTYLVTPNANSGSSKNKSAKKYGIKILDEKAFLTLIGKE